MARRMMSPQTIIKSQVVDDKNLVDLNEILEKHGTTSADYKTITLQIYNKIVTDESLNMLKNDNDDLGMAAINGSITITKHQDGEVYIRGMLLNDIGNSIIPYFEIESGSYENGITLYNNDEFDLYVIRV